MKLRNLFYLLFILPLLIFQTGCSKDDPVAPEPAVNEAQVLAEYLEANGDYLNVTAPAIIGADEVRTRQLADPSKLYIIDVRTAADFTGKGYIAGAKNVALKDIVAHVKGLANAASFERIVVVCYSGQTSGYAVSLLRLLGYTNVFSVKFGMSAWNKEVANSWAPAIGNNFTTFVTTPFAKPAKGELPVLKTGKKTGKDILEARINELLASADPFGDVRIDRTVVTPNLGNYFLLNYWPIAHYNLGHLNGAIQYEPRSSLKLANDLKTLPTNRTIVVYCYTGQTSAATSTILKVLGYDAKSLMFGVNALNYDWMRTNVLTHFLESRDVYNYPYVK